MADALDICAYLGVQFNRGMPKEVCLNTSQFFSYLFTLFLIPC